MTMDSSRDYGSQQGGMMESNESTSETQASAEQMIWQVSQCHGSILSWSMSHPIHIHFIHKQNKCNLTSCNSSTTSLEHAPPVNLEPCINKKSTGKKKTLNPTLGMRIMARKNTCPVK
ncbi:hypothetical protein HanIR_Chr17g0898361 [Helianthus annuus]|nr:hypothetical protein HanIR_Chr17g0898361 [Helianthus annuus]